MIDNIKTVYFTNEGEYISSNGPLMKYSETDLMIKHSVISEESVISKEFEESTKIPFGSIFNFFVTADWHTLYNECAALLDEYEELTDDLPDRVVPIYNGIVAYNESGELYPYFKAVYLINNIYDELCKFSSDFAELFIQCTVSKYFDSLYEFAEGCDFFIPLGLAEMQGDYGDTKEILKLAKYLIDEPVRYVLILLLDNPDILSCLDSGLIAVMYYLISNLSADLRRFAIYAENIKKSADKLIEADKNISENYADLLSINRYIPKIDYNGILQITEEFFEMFYKTSKKLSTEEKIKHKQIKKIKAIRFNSLYSAVCYEINHIYNVNGHLSKCEACGKYFYSKTTRARYCSDCIKYEEYAKQYVDIDEYKKLYLKNNKAYNARYNRDKDKIGEKYTEWQENAKKLLTEAQNGGYTYEEFAKLIELPPPKKKSGRFLK